MFVAMMALAGVGLLSLQSGMITTNFRSSTSRTDSLGVPAALEERVANLEAMLSSLRGENAAYESALAATRASSTAASAAAAPPSALRLPLRVAPESTSPPDASQSLILSAAQHTCAAWKCTCRGLADHYAVFHTRKEWGSATTAAKVWWVAERCEADAAPVADPAICAEWGCTCQGMSDLYNVINSKASFGSAPEAARAWWIKKVCHADPSDPNAPAPVPIDPERMGAALALLAHATPESEWELRAEKMRSELAHFGGGGVAWPDGGAAPGKLWEHRARTLRRTLGRHRCPAGGTSSVGQNGGWCLVGGGPHDECCAATNPPCKRCRFGYYIPWPHTEADTGLAQALASFFAGKSVIDLGAGVGQYGQYFKNHPSIDGAVQYRGYDGAENAEEYTNGFLQWADLSWETDIEPAQWVMSFEVGEHIDREFEGEFIRNLHR